MVFLDYASTTPLHPEVRREMELLWQEPYGNPSSPHFFGSKAKAKLEEAREKVAFCLRALPEEIIFTSGGTESNHLALEGIVKATERKGKILLSAVEHKSLLKPAERLREEGFSLELLPVDESGYVREEKLEAALTEEVLLVSVMMVNNEVGTIEPVAKVGEMCRRKGVLFHCDASQAPLTEKIDVRELHVEALTLSAHIIYGPPGTGALYVRQGVPLRPLFLGGGQERERRAGTPNVGGIVGFAKALELCEKRREERRAHFLKLRQVLLEELEKCKGIKLTVEKAPTVPHFLHFSLLAEKAQSLVVKLDLEGYAVSTGSACSSGAASPSHVLRAIGYDEEKASQGLRVTLGEPTTLEEVKGFASTLSSCLKKWTLLSATPL